MLEATQETEKLKDMISNRWLKDMQERLVKINEKLMKTEGAFNEKKILVEQLFAHLCRQDAPIKQQNDTMTIHYLPKSLKRGPLDGSAPVPEAVAERGVELPVLSETLFQLEQQLNAVVYTDPQGDTTIHNANYEKWT